MSDGPVPAFLILNVAVGTGSGVELLCPPRRLSWASLGIEELLEEMLQLWLFSGCLESQRFHWFCFTVRSFAPCEFSPLARGNVQKKTSGAAG